MNVGLQVSDFTSFDSYGASIGLTRGDIITSVNNYPVLTSEDLDKKLKAFSGGDVVYAVLRGAKTISVAGKAKPLGLLLVPVTIPAIPNEAEEAATSAAAAEERSSAGISMATPNFSAPPNLSGNEVVVVDIRMPFISMVVFMVKWAIAAIPAFIILAVLLSTVLRILGGALSN